MRSIWVLTLGLITVFAGSRAFAADYGNMNMPGGNPIYRNGMGQTNGNGIKAPFDSRGNRNGGMIHNGAASNHFNNGNVRNPTVKHKPKPKLKHKRKIKRHHEAPRDYSHRYRTYDQTPYADSGRYSNPRPATNNSEESDDSDESDDSEE